MPTNPAVVSRAYSGQLGPQRKTPGCDPASDAVDEPQDQICATNVGFGDRDRNGLYITACTHVYRIQVKTAGVRPGPQ